MWPNRNVNQMLVSKSSPGPHLRSVRKCCFAILLLVLFSVPVLAANSWKGILRDSSGHAVADATVSMQPASGTTSYSAKTSSSGEFLFADLAAQRYQLSVALNGKLWKAADPLIIKDGDAFAADLELSAQNQTLAVVPRTNVVSQQASGGEVLSSGQVSSLPLNERDFSKLLLLAAGTMTDTNGAANFTAAVRHQRPARHHRCFRHGWRRYQRSRTRRRYIFQFQRRRHQEVQSSSGVMPAEIGHGAAGFTNVITKSGTDQIHGSAFEFVRNAAFDARNFFDHKSDRHAPLASLCPQRIWRHQWRPFRPSRNLRWPRQDLFLRRISGLPPGARHNAGLRRPHRCRTQRHRYHHFSRRHPDSFPSNPAIAPLLARYPLPERSARPVRRSYLRDLVQSRHRYGSILRARGSGHFR